MDEINPKPWANTGKNLVLLALERIMLLEGLGSESGAVAKCVVVQPLRVLHSPLHPKLNLSSQGFDLGPYWDDNHKKGGDPTQAGYGTYGRLNHS